MNDELLKYVTDDKINCWIGNQPPYGMKAIEISKSTNFRLSSSLHHQFDIVWLYENCMDDYGVLSWKIVLDETIRLIGENGILVVRARTYGAVTPVEIKSFLGRHIGIKVTLDYEHKTNMEICCMVFKINRLDIDKYEDKSWTFGILTTGNKRNNVIDFLKSIRDNEINRSEIIVVGPHDSAYDAYDVIYIDCSCFKENLAEISKKKNAIIDNASNANLMIVHDRYSLANDFFSGFDRYGYDFDFLTVTQITSSGEKFPEMAVHIRNAEYGVQVMTEGWNKLCDGTYVNGGLMIFKTHVIKKVRFNDLLCWEQREDVELTERFITNSIVPRMNYISTVNVLEMREGYLFAFLKERELSDEMRAALFFSAMEQKIKGEWDEFMRNFDDEEVYIFGAGEVTKKMIALCTEKQKFNIRGILVSDCSSNPKEIEGIPVIPRDQCKNDNSKVIIGLLYSKQLRMKDELIQMGLCEKRIVIMSKEVNNALYYLYNKKVNEDKSMERF